VDDVRLAVQDMDIVVSSVPKLERHPVCGAWWSPGTLMVPLDVTGAWDDAVYQAADRLVCDHRENLNRAFARYRPNLAVDESRLVAMQDIAAGTARARGTPHERVLAFMTGVGSIDMALAGEIYRRALEGGAGTRFAFT
jgi:ornithine cyclodeaminase/alanine dehydrogenase